MFKRAHIYKFLLLGFICFPWQAVYSQKLEIRISNKSGYDLDSLFFENNYLGSLKNDSVINIINIDKFIIQSQCPLFRPSAKVQGKKMRVVHAPCSTKSYTVNTGQYSFEIHSWEDELGLGFYWVNKP